MKMERILVPVDFSEHSLAALMYAIELAHEYECEVLLVHVVEPLPRGTMRWSDDTSLLEQHREKACDELKRFEQEATRLYPKCRSELYFGITHDVIEEVVSRLEVDLVVISIHEKTPLVDLLTGGTAHHLLRHARCPVLRLLAD